VGEAGLLVRKRGKKMRSKRKRKKGDWTEVKKSKRKYPGKPEISSEGFDLRGVLRGEGKMLPLLVNLTKKKKK